MSELKEIDREKLADLLAKVQAATGPDAYLDFEIDMAMKGLRNIGGWQALVVATGERVSITHIASPSYTASIDAALTLVGKMLPGWVCETLGEDAAGRIGEMQGMGWTAEFSDGLSTAQGQAPTLPLAILAALLSSLKAST